MRFFSTMDPVFFYNDLRVFLKFGQGFFSAIIYMKSSEESNI